MEKYKVTLTFEGMSKELVKAYLTIKFKGAEDFVKIGDVRKPNTTNIIYPVEGI